MLVSELKRDPRVIEGGESRAMNVTGKTCVKKPSKVSGGDNDKISQPQARLVIARSCH